MNDSRNGSDYRCVIVPSTSRGVASLQPMGGHGQYIDPAQTFLLTKQKANDPMMG